MRFWQWTLAAACLWSAAAIAKSPAEPVRLTVGHIETVTAHAGDSAWVTIPLRVANGFHVNANPAASDMYIPLEVRLDSSRDFRSGHAVYPQGKTWRLTGSDENLLVYGGEVTVKVPVVLDRAVTPGTRVLKGSVDFQACDNEVCFLPESRAVEVTLEVLDRAK